MRPTPRVRPDQFQTSPYAPVSYGWARGLGLNDLSVGQLRALVPEIRHLVDETRLGARQDAEGALATYDRFSGADRQTLLEVVFTLGESAARSGDRPATAGPAALEWANARDAQVWQVVADALTRIGA